MAGRCIRYVFDGAMHTLDDYFARTSATGLLVIKNRKIVIERYARGNGPSTNWTSRSMAKSFTSTLVGMALQTCTVRREIGCLLRETRKLADPVRPGYAAPGTRYGNLGADVIVSGMVLQRATGITPAQYLSSKVWKPFGMERDAYWSLVAAGGGRRAARRSRTPA